MDSETTDYIVLFVPLQIMVTFTLLTGEVESWLMQTLLDRVREGTLTLMMMKPGLSLKEVNILCPVHLERHILYSLCSSLYES